MRRATLVAAFALVALVAPAAQAKPQEVLTDPAGDYPASSADVISATFDTVNKTKLVVTLEYAATPNSQVPYSYQLQFTAGDCDWRGNYFGADSSVTGGCRGSDSDAPAKAEIKGSTLVFTMAAKGKLKPGTTLTGINVNSHPGGALSGGQGTVLGDTGTTDKTYVVGS